LKLELNQCYSTLNLKIDKMEEARSFGGSNNSGLSTKDSEKLKLFVISKVRSMKDDIEE